MTEALTINGVSLASLAYMLPDVSGLFGAPAKRGSNVVVPGRHGTVRVTRKRYDEAEYTLTFWVLGAQADGTVPGGSTAAREFYKRRDELLRILGAETLTLAFTRPDGLVLTSTCEVVDAVDFTRIGAEPLAKVAVAVRNAAAFWLESTPVNQTITGVNGTTATLTQFAAATAPMTDLTITFNGPINNPQLQHGDKFVTYGGSLTSGQQLVIAAASWQVSAGTGSAWTPDLRNITFSPGPEWISLDPTVTPFTAVLNHTTGGSASVTITGRRAYLAV